MSSDFHHNIFYFYRGGQEDDASRSRQLEDNTTKALINILENVDNRITEKFLRWITVSIEEIHNVSFWLQRNDIGTSVLERKDELILLAIVPEREDRLLLPQATKQHSRPDAWIAGDKFAVLIESKVVGGLDSAQLKEHYRKLADNSTVEPKYHEITWGEVHRFFRNEVRSSCNAVHQSDRFLLNEFMEYLDMCDFADFNGFDTDFFDYFFTHDNEEARGWVKNKIKAFAPLMLDDLQKIDGLFYQDYDQGVLQKGDNYAWVAFGPTEKKYRNLAHLTIRFDARGMDVFVNIELKDATDKFKKHLRLRPDALKQALETLCSNDALSFIVEKRKQKQASKYDYIKLMEIESYALSDEKLSDSMYDFLMSTIDNTELPSINIIKRINRNEVILLSAGETPEPLFKEFVSIAEKFHTFISFINHPVASPAQNATQTASIPESPSIEYCFAQWRKRNNPINNWGLAWYLAYEIAHRFYASHGIVPYVICHEGLGYYGIELDSTHCLVNRNRTKPLGRLTIQGNVENWQTGTPGDHGLNAIQMCERGVPAEELVASAIAHLRLPDTPLASHFTCRHKRWGSSFVLLFEIATFLALEYGQNNIYIWNHSYHTDRFIRDLDSKADMEEHLGAFVFQHHDSPVVFASDGRELSGDKKDNYWKRYMAGESSYQLYKDLSLKLKLP
jgi:hypothetical protein